MSPPVPKVPAPDEHRWKVALGATKDAFGNLIKHIKTARLYGPEHPNAERFLSLFVQEVESIVSHDSLELEVKRAGIFVNGEQVVASDGSVQRILFGLYAEGCRGIVVNPGVGPTELRTLAALLGRDWLGRGDFDDDLVASVWRADFEHIYVDLADHFTDVMEQGGEEDLADSAGAGRVSGGAKEHRGDSVLVPEIQGFLAELTAPESALDAVRVNQDEVELYWRLRDTLDAPEAPGGLGEGLLQVDDRSRGLLDQEVAEVDAGRDAPLDRVGDVIFELIRLEHRAGALQDLGRTVAGHVLVLLERQDAAGAAALVRRALALADRDLFAVRSIATFRDGYGVLLRDERLPRLAQVLGQSQPSQRGALFTALSLLPPQSVPALVRLGARLESIALRQILADVVTLATERDLGAILALLEASEDRLAAVPLLALGRFRDPRSGDVALRWTRSADASVREAALRALRGIQSPRIKTEMIARVSDPASNVRTEALRYLAVYRDPMHFETLEQRIREEHLANLPEEEQKAWLLAAAHIGRDRAVPLLRAVVEADLAGRPDAPRLRVLAVQALAATSTREGRLALEVVARRRPELRATVRSLADREL